MPRKTKTERGRIPFAIVGMGASAGGLAALEAFFSHLPADSGKKMAFVLVQHLAPDRKSMLADLLRKHTPLQILDAAHDTAVEPGNIYLTPPRCSPEIREGRLQLSDPGVARPAHLPIDTFFRSLALDQKERSICIILSGSGSDGTLGLKAIKGEGGMAMVQDPDSAEYKQMPYSAIATNQADYVLPPQDLPASLLAYVGNAYLQGTGLPPTPAVEPSALLQKILELLQLKTGHNFSGYKQSTLSRRIERRLAVNQIGQLDEYIHYLQQNPEEAQALFQELLIGVTAFFRDPQAFEALREKVIPRLFAEKLPGDPIRIWVPGCSSGEEAYSLAILLREYMLGLQQNFKIQIFATDIDSQSIEKARAGIYPANIEADVSADRIRRFFLRDSDNNTFTVQKTIREMLVFSEHNIASDPPFSRLDLISCRNMLIYMDGDLQKKILSLLSYALNPKGFLFLGNAESVGELVDHFNSIDRRWKIYQNRGAAPFHQALKSSLLFVAERGRQTAGVQKESRSGIRELVEKKLLQQYTPACAVITRSGDILYIHGRTGKYLEPAPGEINMNIMQMAREGLKAGLSALLRQAVAQNKPAAYRGLQVKGNGETTSINLILTPLDEADPDLSSLFLVVFEEVPTVEGQAQLLKEAAAAGEIIPETEVTSLEKALRDKEEYLQIIIEELETSNEELQSTNEEFQSTNEELETSREELQSVNEELVTLNAELQSKLAELSRANNDMHNMLAGTGVGTVFVDLQQRIRHFTPNAVKVINLIPGDLGRPVNHLSSNLENYDQLAGDVQEVLDTLVPKEVEVRTGDGTWYLMRILPYRTMDNVIEGVTINFVDISELKRSFELSRHLAVVVRDSNDAVTVQDFEGWILAWNPGAQRLYGWTGEEALSMNIRSTIPEGRRDEALAMLKKLAASETLEPFKTWRLTKNGTEVEVWMTASVLQDEAGKPYAIATTESAVAGGR